LKEEKTGISSETENMIQFSPGKNSIRLRNPSCAKAVKSIMARLSSAVDDGKIVTTHQGGCTFSYVYNFYAVYRA
jgi:hypothetical protein